MTWRVLYVRPAGERFVTDSLDERKVDWYVPHETVWRGLGPRRRRIDRPLIPGMVFARFADDQIPVLAHLDGVTRVLTAHARKQRLVDSFIAEVRQAEEAGIYNKAPPPRELKPGQAVLIVRGAFKGMAATVAALSTKRRVQIVTSLFGRQGSMTVDESYVELVAA